MAEHTINIGEWFQGLSTMVQGMRSDMAERERHKDSRSDVKDALLHLPKCDGTSPREVRDWLEDIDLALGVLTDIPGAPARLVSGASSGLLHREIEQFFRTVNRHNIPWVQIRDYLTAKFVSTHEGERLKMELDSIVQRPDETLTGFNRRFKNLAMRAYKQDNEDSRRLVLRAYIRALRDRRLAERIIVSKQATCVSDAVKFVENYQASSELFSTMNAGLQHEPMELGATATMDTSVVEAVQHLSSEIAAIRQDIKHRDQGRQDFRNVRCYNCGKLGHVRAMCRTRQTVSRSLYVPNTPAASQNWPRPARHNTAEPVQQYWSTNQPRSQNPRHQNRNFRNTQSNYVAQQGNGRRPGSYTAASRSNYH